MKVRVGQRVKFNSVTIWDSAENKELIIRDVSMTATGKVATNSGRTMMLFVDADKDILPGIDSAWLPIEEMDPSEFPEELFAYGTNADIRVVEDKTTIELAGKVAYIPDLLLTIDEMYIISEHLGNGSMTPPFVPVRVVADWRLEDENGGTRVIALCRLSDEYFLLERDKDDEGFMIMSLKSQETAALYAEVALEDPPNPGLTSLITSAARSNEWVDI